jgi:hypothetical protein
LANIEGNQLVFCFKTSLTTSAVRFRHSRENGNPGEGGHVGPPLHQTNLDSRGSLS